jgi:hypothetical protein
MLCSYGWRIVHETELTLALLEPFASFVAAPVVT